MHVQCTCMCPCTSLPSHTYRKMYGSRDYPCVHYNVHVHVYMYCTCIMYHNYGKLPSTCISGVLIYVVFVASFEVTKFSTHKLCTAVHADMHTAIYNAATSLLLYSCTLYATTMFKLYTCCTCPRIARLSQVGCLAVYTVL